MAGLNAHSHRHLHNTRPKVNFEPDRLLSLPLPVETAAPKSPYLHDGGPRLDDFVYPPPASLISLLERAPTTIVATGSVNPTITATSSPTSTCIGPNGKNHCQYSDDSITLPITLGVIIPLVAAFALLIFLHRRTQRRLRAEDATDKHGSLDFGLGESHRPKYGKKGAVPPALDITEKDLRHGKGMSLDLVSPYLPAEIHSTRSSNSLSRSAYDAEDPFRTVSEWVKENQSPSRSPSRVDNRSVYTASSRHSDSGKHQLLSPGQASSLSAPGTSHPLDTSHVPPLPDSAVNSPTLGDHAGQPLLSSTNAEHGIPQIHTTSDENPYVPNLEHENGQGNRDSHLPMPTMPEIHLPEEEIESPPAYPLRNSSHAIIENADSRPLSERTNSREVPSRQELDLPPGGPSDNSSRANSAGPFDEWATYADVLGIVQKESDDVNYPADGYHQDAHANDVAGHHDLGVPDDGEKGVKRLSASIRPLPPDDPTDTAEQRANRIRSFYREYFDGGGDYDDDGADYYEDYGQEYLNGATIWDPETGQFIIANAPHADPITRRAMTPPPRGPPRFRHDGSRQRSGSAAQFRRPHGQRTFSSASGQHLRPGGARGRPVGRPLPPPSPLRNLPSPYLLGEDTTMFNPIEFAPATNVKGIRAGKSDSPLLEQRPYSPSVRAFTPLVSSFNALADMPSPYALRKSSTFTGLDFAPPPRIRDVDSGSDSASLRSGRSNKSALQVANIRAGAYRLSRLPKEQVGTKDDISAALKPNWDMR